MNLFALFWTIVYGYAACDLMTLGRRLWVPAALMYFGAIALAFQVFQ